MGTPLSSGVFTHNVTYLVTERSHTFRNRIIPKKIKTLLCYTKINETHLKNWISMSYPFLNQKRPLILMCFFLATEALTQKFTLKYTFSIKIYWIHISMHQVTVCRIPNFQFQKFKRLLKYSILSIIHFVHILFRWNIWHLRQNPNR